jgi:hypothetical protein
MLKIQQNTLLWWAGESGHNVWLTEEFLFSLKWVIKFSLKWVASCRSYVRFISLFCPVNLLKYLSPKNRYDFKFRYIFLRYVTVIVFKQCSPSLDDVPHL